MLELGTFPELGRDDRLPDGYLRSCYGLDLRGFRRQDEAVFYVHGLRGYQREDLGVKKVVGGP